MATVDGIPDEGNDPTEEVGPEGCEPTPADSSVRVGELDGPPEESDFAQREELIDEFPVEPIPIVIDPTDGLPRPVDQDETFAPPFTHLHVVCIEDRRAYVELFVEEMPARGWWQQLTRDSSRPELDPRFPRWVPPGQRFAPPIDDEFVAVSRFDENGGDRQRMRYVSSDVVRLWGVECVKIAQDTFRPVRPQRERCKYYARQCFNNDDEPDWRSPGGRINFTHCMRRRSVGGAFMSLKDQAVFACDHRDPPDEESVRIHLDAFDERRLVEKPHETKIPQFGFAGEDVKVRS